MSGYKKLLVFVFFILYSLSFGTLAKAAGGDSDNYNSTTSKPYGYSKAVKLVRDENYEQAITALSRLALRANKDADIQNLLGFSYRKTKQYDKAASHYEKALSLNPKHKGALEYQAELFLILKDKPRAEANYEKLKKICWLGCEELDELEQALKNYQP